VHTSGTSTSGQAQVRVYIPEYLYEFFDGFTIGKIPELFSEYTVLLASGLIILNVCWNICHFYAENVGYKKRR